MGQCFCCMSEIADNEMCCSKFKCKMALKEFERHQRESKNEKKEESNGKREDTKSEIVKL